MRAIANEIIDFLEKKALKEALSWVYEVKVLTGEYPSIEEFLEKKSEYYRMYFNELKKWIQEVSE